MPEPVDEQGVQRLGTPSPGGVPPESGATGASVQFEGWPALLGKLASGEDLGRAGAASAMRQVLEGSATPSQLAALIFGLRLKGETPEELVGMLTAMLEVAEVVVVPEEAQAHLVDTCGTGGDHSGTINISTIAALVVAGAGVHVCKHGGRGASSRTGSADVLEALGVQISLPPEAVARCIMEAGIGFCFAPRYHPAMRHVVSTRRELGVPTAFNLLGPLANPARAKHQLVGVGDGRAAEKLARVLGSMGSHRAWVVHGEDGLDEISTVAPTKVVEWSPGQGGLTSFFIDPASLGLSPAHRDQLVGGDAADNAQAARAILEGRRGPQRDIVMLNAAAALVVAGQASDLVEGLAQAEASIDNGAGAQCLAKLVEVSQNEATGAP